MLKIYFYVEKLERTSMDWTAGIHTSSGRTEQDPIYQEQALAMEVSILVRNGWNMD